MTTERHTALKVDGMTCQSCVRHVSHALTALPGVGDVKVTLSDGKVVVDHDPEKAPVALLIDALTDAGYKGTALT